MERWVIKSEKNIFSSSVFTLKELRCAHPEKEDEFEFFILNSPDWINVVAVTENNEIIFVRQHRLGTDEYTYETPAGLMEKDEDPFDAARRELLEETGYAPGSLRLMKKLSANPAIQNNYIYFFCATGCTRISGQDLDLQEDIDVELYPEEQVVHMIESGEIDHSIIVNALNLYFSEKRRAESSLSG
ncbi:MAG TPA: NUDIX hydrolase [Spirochaetota bacterium]|nr:NUDIX hydrolase [Spirochaetota bacterium]